MELRQAADNTLSYQMDPVPQPRPARASAKRIGIAVYECPRSTGPAMGRSRTNGRPGWSAPTAKTGFGDAEPTPSTFPADGPGDQDVVGSHRGPTFSSLRLRAAQHFTYRLAAET